MVLYYCTIHTYFVCKAPLSLASHTFLRDEGPLTCEILIHPPHPFLGPQVTLFALMDQEVARRLFAEGAALVLLDVPQRTEVGIDYNCWSVGPRFKGIKMIPPGFHFVFYR